MDYDQWKLNADPIWEPEDYSDEYIYWDELEDVRNKLQEVIYMLSGESSYCQDDLLQYLSDIAQDLNLFPPTHPLKRQVNYEIK